MSIPAQLVNKEKCEQRNRIAAHREGIDSFPISLLQKRPAKNSNAREIETFGKLDETDEEAVEQINKFLKDSTGAELTVDDIWVHHAEAANSNFVQSYYMFLGDSTLKNFVSDALEGVSFMNSHKTGGFSSEPELPFGRTHSGQFSKVENGEGKVSSYSMLGFYMMRDCFPNGANGPNTNDMSRMISGGVLQDCSVGFYIGRSVCDVCGEDSFARNEDGEYLCRHIPGSHYKMNEEQIAAQKDRGVSDGRASFTSEDGGLGELSGVYDGAVPGAGFRKAINMARSGELSRSAWPDIKAVYGKFLGRRDLPMNLEDIAEHVKSAVSEGVTSAMRNLSFKRKAEELEDEDKPDKPVEAAKPAENDKPPEETSMSAEENATLAALTARLDSLEKENKQLQADYKDEQKRSNDAESQRKDKDARNLVDRFIGFKIAPAVLQKDDEGNCPTYDFLVKQAMEDPKSFELYMTSQPPLQGLSMRGAAYTGKEELSLPTSTLTDTDRTVIAMQAEKEGRQYKEVEAEWLATRAGRLARRSFNAPPVGLN